jgi:hypothetical protein
LNVLGGFFYLNGTVGVGSGNYTLLSGLTIGSPHLDCRSMGTKICIRASSVFFDAGSMTMITGASKMIAFNTIDFSDASELYTIYTDTSIPESITGIPIIHIEFSTSLPYEISKLIVHNSDETTQLLAREVIFDSNSHRGFAISVPSIGNYIFTSTSNDSLLCKALSLDSVATFAFIFPGDLESALAPFVGRTIGEDLADALSTSMPIAKIQTNFHRSQHTIEMLYGSIRS